VARPGWYAESEWVPSQGWNSVQHAVEQGFQGPFFKRGLRQWIKDKTVVHDTSHVHEFVLKRRRAEWPWKRAGQRVAEPEAILGVFDEGCMGMMNAIVEDS